MSSHRPQHRLSVPDIQRRKGAGSLVALTAYSTPMARLLDPHADLLLVRRFAGHGASMACPAPWE
ncbi:3-methyl-2-oxobutanoate hydroxymethyltransferase [Pseudomonas aeruginosa]|nr:3-methyl-2-oxobutanoate hydroxymethyltransferase [Pseudomonas aeruginosa]